ncbi:hypothetical protein CFP56_036964 [Quercus suber]|uniref:Uncharacterized protein n=1 Tax=Quercus suber TaxID=58331 RepID=A0AAW0J5W8_QUESU
MKRCLSLLVRFFAITVNLHSLPDHWNRYWGQERGTLELYQSLAFSSPVSTAVAVLALLQIPLQPFGEKVEANGTGKKEAKVN